MNVIHPASAADNRFVLRTDVKFYYASIDHFLLLDQLAAFIRDRRLLNLLGQFFRNPAELATIRGRLAHNRLTAPLFDKPRFARNLEGAYKEMWRLYLVGETPRMIEVVDAAP